MNLSWLRWLPGVIVLVPWLLAPVDAPDFSLPDLSGQVHTLSSLRGKPVLLNFWGTQSVQCSEDLSSGFAPDSVEYGLRSSVAEYTVLQFSQASPYWSFAPQFGHSPLM